MATQTIVAGGSAHFEAELLQNGNQISLPAGSTWAWTSADPLVTFTPAPVDPTTGVSDPDEITATIAGSEAQTSVVISASTTAPDGTTVSGDITVPVTPEAQVFSVKIVQVDDTVAA